MVIFLRYISLRHNGFWEVIQITPFITMWRNPCIWRSKSCKLHVDFTFRCGVDFVYFVKACRESNLGDAFQIRPILPLLKHFVDKNRPTTILIADNILTIAPKLKKIKPIPLQKEIQSSAFLKQGTTTLRMTSQIDLSCILLPW